MAEALQCTAPTSMEASACDEKMMSTYPSRVTFSTACPSVCLSDSLSGRDWDEVSVATSSSTWQMPEGTMIFMDWDDTILPTAWLQARPLFEAWWQGRVPVEEVLTSEEAQWMSDLDQAARGFLVAASQLGKVVCVTLARSPWVECTMKAFLPRLWATWHELGIETHYASDAKVVSPTLHNANRSGQRCENGSELDLLETEVLSKKKQRAMAKALRKFHGRQGSWKNVLSIGDGIYERRALQDLGFEHTNPVSRKNGKVKNLRVKTVKLAEEPHCSQICDTLQLLQAWLPKMVFWATDFDMDLGAECDDDELPLDHQRRFSDAALASAA